MTSPLEDIAALLIVALASAYLVRCGWRYVSSLRLGKGCRGCSSCGINKERRG